MDKNNSLIKYTPQSIERVGKQLSIIGKLIKVEEILIPYRKKDKWGYCKPDKTIVIPCIYDFAYRFKEGYARVEKNGKYGFINKEGKELTPFYDIAYSFSEGYAPVKKNGKWGFINKSGVEYWED
ncbi:MAG: hypothetical protein A2X08_04630 [Bacteroidetes bacterium GWA2_32_17]|nr:MAG: hypothetical protein A2X08_04630 [Bacteroidetes bacterium GWA2_32_17]